MIFDADRHRSIERSSSRSNWPFARSQSTDRSLVRRSVHLLMSESNSNISQMDSEVKPAFLVLVTRHEIDFEPFFRIII